MAFRIPEELSGGEHRKRMADMGGTHILANEVVLVDRIRELKTLFGGDPTFAFVILLRGDPGHKHLFEYDTLAHAELAKQRLLDAVEWFAGAR